MAKNRFVSPNIERLPLSEGDWIEIKKQLTIADQKRLEAAGLVPKLVDGKLFNVVDWTIHDIERAAIFITDWSLRGADDKPVAYSYDALKSVDTDTFTEINQAILTYVLSQADAKKAQREMKTTTPPAE